MNLDIYWNSRLRQYSVRDRSTGKVIRHTDCIYLSAVSFVVGEKGRQRAVEQKRKNAHAFVRGIHLDDGGSEEQFNAATGIHIMYDPNIAPFFFSKQDGREVTAATTIRCGTRYVEAGKGPYWTVTPKPQMTCTGFVYGERVAKKPETPNG
jgi:hypothetical protein